MLGIGRRKNHAELARKELNESLDHFMQAATHAAGGMGATVGPRVNTAREFVTPTAGRMKNAASQGWESTVSAFAPLASAAKDGARSAGDVARKAKSRNKKEQAEGRKRWSVLAGMLAAGAAVGAAGALIVRRRKQRWEEYDPAHALEAMRDEADSTVDSATESMDRTAGKAATTADEMAAEASGTLDAAKDKSKSMAESAKDKTKSMVESTKDKASSAAESTRRQADQATDKAEGFVSKSTPSRNSRS